MNIWQRSSTPKYSGKALIPICGAACAILFAVSLLVGSSPVNIPNAVKEIVSGMPRTDGSILLYVRLPRAIAACLAGAALSVSGVIVQGVLNNAMASPSIIGVNAGAGFAVSLMAALLPAAVTLVPIAAFVGAALTGMLIYLIAAKTGASRMTITLTGIAISSLLTALMSGVKALFPDIAYNLSSFSVGGFSGISLRTLTPSTFGILVCLVLAVIFSKKADILALGEDTAHSLGLNVKRTRLLFLILAGALAGLAVSFAGLIGFIGLVIPHITRRFTGNRHSVLIPLSSLLGASLVLVCDTLSRVLFAPYELPTGIMLSLIGAPFFIALIFSSRGKMYD